MAVALFNFDGTDWNLVLDVLVGAIGSLAGLQVACLGILVALLDKPMLRKMRATGHLSVMVGFALASTGMLLFALLAGIGALMHPSMAMVCICFISTALGFHYLVLAGYRYVQTIRFLD